MPWPRFVRNVFDRFFIPAAEKEPSTPIKLKNKDQEFIPTLFSIYRQDLDEGYFFKDFPRVCRRIHIHLPASTASFPTEANLLIQVNGP